ncbi:MAG: hypothetical protein Q9217_000482, partial [Psora testacea]
MTTRNYHKRACGVVLLKHVKNPIKLAREMLIRGQTDGSGGHNGGGSGDPAGGSGGAQGHCCLGGETAERLAREWRLEMVDENYFKTKKRWDEHRRGLKDANRAGQGASGYIPEEVTLKNLISSGWDVHPYLPQGTVGCVALDQHGTICVATSTGGLTNKLPLRIGDTPTIGAGFWAEEWHMDNTPPERPLQDTTTAVMLDGIAQQLITGLRGIIADCLPHVHGYKYTLLPQQRGVHAEKDEDEDEDEPTPPPPPPQIHAIALSGTGNGDSFLRLCAARTAGAI